MLKSTMLQDRPISREQLREQIRKSVVDAQIAAEKAATEAAKAGDEAAAQGGGTNVIQIPTPPLPPTFPGIQVHTGGRNEIPPQVENISIAFFVMVAAIIIGLPIMRAFARRIERGTPKPAAISPEVAQQLQQISQSVDAIAIEVERISEGQRYTTKLLSDKSKELTG